MKSLDQLLQGLDRAAQRAEALKAAIAANNETARNYRANRSPHCSSRYFCAAWSADLANPSGETVLNSNIS